MEFDEYSGGHREDPAGLGSIHREMRELMNRVRPHDSSWVDSTAVPLIETIADTAAKVAINYSKEQNRPLTQDDQPKLVELIEQALNQEKHTANGVPTDGIPVSR